MGKHDRGIKAGHAPQGQIPTPPPPVKDLVTFSFKYFLEADKFCWKRGGEHFVDTLLVRLKGVSQLPFSEFRQPIGNPKSLRSHEIDFSRTTEKSGFPFSSQLWPVPWQFEISKGGGRVHGFIAGTIFFVVWFDPDHLLYS